MCAVRAPGSGGARIAMNYLRHRLPSHGLSGSTHTRGRRSLDRICGTHDVPSPRNYVRHESAGTPGAQAGYYGALRTPQGRISVRWDWLRDAQAQERLFLEWVETGGPPVVIPSQPGYGTSAIRNVVPYELDGTVDLTFDAEGLRCRIELPSKCIRSDTPATNPITVSDSAPSPA